MHAVLLAADVALLTVPAPGGSAVGEDRLHFALDAVAAPSGETALGGDLPEEPAERGSQPGSSDHVVDARYRVW